MGHTVCLALVIISTSYVGHALPISGKDELLGDALKQNLAYLIGTTFAVLICVISLLIICACWGNKKRLQLHTISSQIELQNQSIGSSAFASTLSSHLSTSDSKIYFEPLPDITPRAQVKKVSVSLVQSENWFAEPYQNFPRNQLQYIRKIGSGWFGQVLEGRAVGIDTDHTSTAISRLKSEIDCNTVIVKCLREDATTDEQSYFLQELLPYKKLHHSNLLRVLSFCLEAQPFLILLEYCAKGDLKSVLTNEAFSDIYLMKMAEGVAEGLCHMHKHDFVHTDLAARNCLVTKDYVVKIGDYGNSIEAFKNEYYLAERIALPLRWCAPESLNCTETTIETVELTKAANVWSFGILLWEILSRARLPYQELGNDEVIQKVILENSVRLKSPFEAIRQDEINNILEACFVPCNSRLTMESVCSMLKHFSDPKSTEEDEFEKRWNQLTSPSKTSTVQAPCSFNSATDHSPNVGWSSLTADESKVESNESQICQRPFSPVLSLLPSEEQYDSLAPIKAAIQILDDSLYAKGNEVKLSNADVHYVDANHESEKWSTFLTESEEDFLTKRLEQGEFSELVRVKSQSVQDLMCLTVIDYSSDSSERASQMGSLPGDPSSLVSEKNFCSEGNLKEASRDDGFMVELERLQVEHRYSIISEVSREDASLDNRDPLDEFSESHSVHDSGLFTEQLSSSDNSQLKLNFCDGNTNEYPQSNVPTKSNTSTNVDLDAVHFRHFTTISDSNKETNTCGHNTTPDGNQNNFEELHQKEKEPREDFTLSTDGQEFKPESVDGGNFWKLQMVAWQEAAQETRELLQEAAQGSAIKSEESEAFPNLLDSPNKNSETSEENSETYISFDPPKEDEYLVDNEENAESCEINPADIMALRQELSLTLNTSVETSTDLEEQEEIFINYRSGPVSLSPIKEESLVGECDSFDDTDISADDYECVYQPNCDSADVRNCSDEGIADPGEPVFIEESNRPVGSTDTEQFNVAFNQELLLKNDTSSKYLCSNVCEPLEPDSGYANLLARDTSIGPHYQSYFNTGVTNVIQCGASLEDGSIYDSTEHTSLPYEVNFPDKVLGHHANAAISRDTWSLTLASNNNDLSDVLHSFNDEEVSHHDTFTPLDDSQRNNVVTYQNGTTEVSYVDLQPMPRNDMVEPTSLMDDDDHCDSPNKESDIESSSTSGEFVWMGNELPANPNHSGRSPGDGSPKFLDDCDRIPGDGSSKLPSDCSEDDSDSGEEEFTPSMWNSKLIPNHSLLKCPERMSSVKKRVHWKQQKHHRVYEYPPEPVTWHAEETQQRRTWGGHNLDYLTLADWELSEELSTEDSEHFEHFSCTNHTNSVPSIYNIAPLPYQNDDSMVVDDCDFLIRSSAPFSMKKAALSDHEYFQSESNSETVEPISDNDSQEQCGSTTSTSAVGEMRYSKDNLRLNLPPILGPHFHNDILDNQRSDDQVLNNDACSNFPQ